MKKKKIIIIFLLQAAICILIYIIACASKYEPYKAEYTVEDISANSAGYRFDQVFKPGSYDIDIHYTSSDDKTTYRFEGDPANDFKAVDAWFQSSVTGYFSNYAGTKRLSILLNFKTPDLMLRIDNIGEDFKIESIYIAKNDQMGRINAIRLFLIFIFADAVWLFFQWYRKKSREKDIRNITIGLVLLIFVSCIPLLFHGLNDTYDVPTHLLRIEGLKEALLSGQFPARIHPIQTYGYGYASSIFYPELFLYFPALLRICSFTIVASFKMFVVAVNAATVLIAFFSFKGIFKEDWAAFCGAVLYTLSPYRIGDVYYRQAVGEYLSFMAFPLITCALYQILKDKNKKAYIYLAIGFTIVLQSHILSVIYVAVGCVMAVLIFHREFFKKNALIQSGLGLLFTVLLNLWYIIPFLYYFRDKYNTFEEYIQGRGLSVTQLFVVFLYPKINDPYIAGFIPYGIGLSVLVCLFMLVIFYKKGNGHSRMAFWSLLCGCVLALMSTRYFPWDSLAHMGGILQKLIFNLQFPARMCEPMTICLVTASVTALLWVYEKYNKYDIIKFILICMVCITAYIQSAAFTDNVIQKNDMFSMTLMDLDTTLVGIADEYYPEGVTHETLAERENYIEISGEDISVSDFEKSGSNVTMYVKNTGGDGYVDLPVAAYGGMYSKDAKISKSGDGVMRVMIPAGYEGRINTVYRENILFVFADIVSLAGLVFLVGLLRKQKIA